MIYHQGGKGLEVSRNSKCNFKRGGVRNKIDEHKFLLEKDVHRLLREIEIDENNSNRSRDHGIIFCGFYLGLRIGEVGLLRRHHFKWIAQQYADIPTLKQKKKPGVDYAEWPPLVRLPAVEPFVAEYLTSYLNNMASEQDSLFVSTNIHKPISRSMVERIFTTYAIKIGLSNNYSFHALRHGRGVYLWEQFKPDLQKVQHMLRHSSLKATEFYMHMSPSSREELLRKLGGSSAQKIKPLTRG